MKNIIVPVDFSESAENALYIAANIAKKESAALHLIHSLEIGDPILEMPASSITADAAPYVKFAEMRFKKFIDKPYLEDLDVSYTVRKASISKEVNAFAKDLDAELIIMGSHGANGIGEYFIGSNTQKVVRHADIPVMVIKKKMNGFSISEAVFASDFTLENLQSYIKAADFFKMLDVTMHLVYINTPDNFKSTKEITTRIENFFALIDQEYYRPAIDVEICNDYSVERGIMEYSGSVNAGLIGIPTHGRKGLSHFFLGSIGEKIVNHSDAVITTFKI